jgi:F0F1-type ATP synthase assembly protein I
MPRDEMPGDDELLGRLEKIREGLHDVEPPEPIEIETKSNVPDVDHAALDAKLDQLEQRVREAKGGYAKAVNKQTPKAIAQDNKNAHGTATGMMIAYSILGFPMLGAGLGALVDWRFGPHFGLATGVLGGTTLGLIIAVRMMRANT